MKAVKGLGKISGLLLVMVISFCLSGFDAKAASQQTYIAVSPMVTTMECSVWNAPETTEVNRVKKVPKDYEVTVFPNKVTGVDGKEYYQTIKGKYILCKCLITPAEAAQQKHEAVLSGASKKVGSYRMLQFGSTKNGIPLYFYEEQRPEDWYVTTTQNLGYYDANGQFVITGESVESVTDKYPGQTCWPQYLIDAAYAVGYPKEASDYVKAVSTAQYLSARMVNNYSNDLDTNNTLYALANNKTGTAGYSKVYYNMMHMLGIECYYEVGYQLVDKVWTYHTWNRVVINGRSYYVDLAWCKGDTAMKYTMADGASFLTTHKLSVEVDSTVGDILW